MYPIVSFFPFLRISPCHSMNHRQLFSTLKVICLIQGSLLNRYFHNDGMNTCKDKIQIETTNMLLTFMSRLSLSREPLTQACIYSKKIRKNPKLRSSRAQFSTVHLLCICQLLDYWRLIRFFYTTRDLSDSHWLVLFVFSFVFVITDIVWTYYLFLRVLSSVFLKHGSSGNC